MSSRIENVNAVTTRSGRVLNPAAPQGENLELAIDLQETKPEEVRESAKEDTAKESLPACVYAPRVPYSTRPKKSWKDLKDAKCKEMLDGLTVKLSLVNAIQMIPSMKRYVKGLVTNDGLKPVNGEDGYLYEFGWSCRESSSSSFSCAIC
ncbi:unnamed protein product [Arabis nemorensis]|uniref:Uncharacterized protein n=1 Tax=Arabis nemorensis TaxID=586526 RepID=A0A565BDF9_9BRAS|nr:unnamed protein product [Arabis nemorensis]